MLSKLYLKMVVVTLKLEEELHLELKKLALDDDSSLQRYLKKIVKEHLSNNGLKMQNKSVLCTYDESKINKDKNLFQVETAFMPKKFNT